MTAESLQIESHPTRVRGLKPYYGIRSNLGQESHPTRVRGLKLRNISGNVLIGRRTPRGCVD